MCSNTAIHLILEISQQHSLLSISYSSTEHGIFQHSLFHSWVMFDVLLFLGDFQLLILELLWQWIGLMNIVLSECIINIIGSHSVPQSCLTPTTSSLLHCGSLLHCWEQLPSLFDPKSSSHYFKLNIPFNLNHFSPDRAWISSVFWLFSSNRRGISFQAQQLQVKAASILVWGGLGREGQLGRGVRAMMCVESSNC